MSETLPVRTTLVLRSPDLAPLRGRWDLPSFISKEKQVLKKINKIKRNRYRHRTPEPVSSPSRLDPKPVVASASPALASNPGRNIPRKASSAKHILSPPIWSSQAREMVF